MKTLMVVRVDYLDGDTHFVFLESNTSRKNQNAQVYDKLEAKQVSKREAPKPLVLNRT
jgi:hypothetical protein